MKKLFVSACAALVMVAGACAQSKGPEPAKKPETVREKAGAVGKLGDQTATTNLEKGLTGAVDSAAKNAKELDKASSGQ